MGHISTKKAHRNELRMICFSNRTKKQSPDFHPNPPGDVALSLLVWLSHLYYYPSPSQFKSSPKINISNHPSSPTTPSPKPEPSRKKSQHHPLQSTLDRNTSAAGPTTHSAPAAARACIIIGQINNLARWSPAPTHLYRPRGCGIKSSERDERKNSALL